MEKMEVKKIDIVSFIKVFLYFMILPILLFVGLGFVMVLMGIATEEEEMIFVGLMYALGMPIFGTVIYGILGVLSTLIYNLLASKFGGLKMTVNREEKDFGMDRLEYVEKRER